MSEFVIRGGTPLHGECVVQGSKNSVLPILAASLLVNGETLVHNCPRIRDVDCAREILRALGCRARQQGSDIYIDSRTLSGTQIPDDLMKRMRSSVLFAGALLAHAWKARRKIRYILRRNLVLVNICRVAYVPFFVSFRFPP